MNVKYVVSQLVPKGIKKSKFYQNLKLSSDKKIFLDGYNTFLQTGKTPEQAYMAIIKMYCGTNGEFTETFANKLKLKNPAKVINEPLTGIIGNFLQTDFKKVNTELNEKGYSHFEKKLSKELCNSLYQFASITPARIPPAYNEKIIYQPDKPQAEIYRFDIKDLVNNSDIQQLMMDPVLLNIARNYLGCEPIFDFPAMWWSTAFQKEASSEAAQLYHFDMDRVKWLKLFFYINDVTMENGPHCYIQGSHLPDSKPMEMLQRGYVRIKDEELHPYYKAEDIKVVTGEAGDVFAGDTKCWHKGIPLNKGHRLVLEFEYTSSMFGVNSAKLEIENASDEFKAFCKANKVFAQNMELK